ncbi:MAG: aminoacyl-tRNA hydrolase [Candidatus Azambacteria bacterium]|nr:aminoacyl-tRNA hydrolase [Candidatus Azambacteria bacterium]
MNKIKTKLIVGLGNPEKEFENTRHNTGFLFVDELSRQWEAKEFVNEKKLFSEITKAKILLAKPQTFMNKSGDAVSALSKFYKIKPENILVVHDDIDILWSNFKFSFGRSSAGHKGIESIIKTLKTKNFWRLRIGIQPAFAKATAGKPTLKKRTSADKIILKKFTPAELKILNQTIKRAISELE